MRPGTVVGWGLGLGTLVCCFFLPFWNLTTGQNAPPDTLYGTLRFTAAYLPTIVLSGILQVAPLALIIIGSGSLVVASGLVGIYPGKAGAFGALGMLALTLGPVVLFPSYDFTFSKFGLGYWAIWGLSVRNVLVGIGLRGRIGSKALTNEAGVTAAPSINEPEQQKVSSVVLPCTVPTGGNRTSRSTFSYPPHS